MASLANHPFRIHILHLKAPQGARRLLNDQSRIYSQSSFKGRLFCRQCSSLRSGIAKNDGRARLSGLWVPTSGISESSAEDSHSKLIRAGFLRQAHSGIFHMLPLGRRVQDKLEALIDKYMSKLNASKLALSSISSEELWAKSGRLKGIGSELFRFKDRKDAGYLLAPTHEEEITTLVSNTTTSYKELPIRLYQISRKYRDEKRPRQGLLRSREFTMKDLYTFDYSASLALETYHEVREIYARIFDDLKIPYLVADADSGNMGGKLSHEFHFPTSKGEDNIISCTNCDYVANEELAESLIIPDDTLFMEPPLPSDSKVLQSRIGQFLSTEVQVWRGISQDRNTLINVWYPSLSGSSMARPDISEINVHAIKSVLPDIDASIENPLSIWLRHSPPNPAISEHGSAIIERRQILHLLDFRVVDRFRANIHNDIEASGLLSVLQDPKHDSNSYTSKLLYQDPLTGRPLNLMKIRNGDRCNRCSVGKLSVQKAIELGHTFHLGTRYSEPLEATVTVPAHLLKDETTVKFPDVQDSSSSQRVPMQMGCHGIGVSRIIGAVADTLADEKGLNWPRVMAPFEVVVIPTKGLEEAALEVYDMLSNKQEARSVPSLDLVLDDRTDSFPWKMGDADLVGYPVIVVVGRRWNKESICEVQCRRLKVRQDIALGELSTFIESLLSQL